ncbi:MAG: peptide-methionine (S)-S-oxide reductase MsrA [bacterium]|nr:peptide-methionine (S)-S-oxide reductase MsrA [bacterium]
MTPTDNSVALATFAGGCFWCMQPAFDQTPGVLKTTVGYSGGDRPKPRYEQVVTGATGHSEAIQIEFDPQEVGYSQLLEIYWQNIDPTQENGQFADIGSHYQTVIFYHDEGQRVEAEASKQGLAESGKFSAPIVTQILPAKDFYPAEEYHQKYYEKNPLHYEAYKIGSGRARFLSKNWGKKS